MKSSWTRITTALAGGLALLVSLLGTPLFIRFLVRRQYGQPIHDDLVLHYYGESGDDTARLDLHLASCAECRGALQRLQQAVIANHNVFAVLMDAVRCCSLGQITSALFEVGGQYRRSM